MGIRPHTDMSVWVSHPPQNTRWVCVCPKMCTHGTGGTLQVTLAPELSPSALSWGQQPSLLQPSAAGGQTPMISRGCSDPSSPAGCSRGGRCPCPAPRSPRRPTRGSGLAGTVPALPLPGAPRSRASPFVHPQAPASICQSRGLRFCPGFTLGL